MSTASAVPPAPEDKDLQHLYDEVWAGFSEDSSTSEKDLEKIYSVYGDDNESNNSPTLNSPISAVSPSCKSCPTVLLSTCGSLSRLRSPICNNAANTAPQTVTNRQRLSPSSSTTRRNQQDTLADCQFQYARASAIPS